MKKKEKEEEEQKKRSCGLDPPHSETEIGEERGKAKLRSLRVVLFVRYSFRSESIAKQPNKKRGEERRGEVRGVRGE